MIVSTTPMSIDPSCTKATGAASRAAAASSVFRAEGSLAEGSDRGHDGVTYYSATTR